MKKDNNKEISSTPSGKLTRPQDYMRINKQQEEKPGVLTPKSLKKLLGVLHLWTKQAFGPTAILVVDLSHQALQLFTTKHITQNLFLRAIVNDFIKL